MSGKQTQFTDAELDAALDLLKAPAPSDTLVARTRRMAPPRPATRYARLRPSGSVAAAAAIAVVIGLAAVQATRTDGPATPVAAVDDPAGEIPVSQLAVSGDVPATGEAPAEPISLAGLPLE